MRYVFDLYLAHSRVLPCTILPYAPSPYFLLPHPESSYLPRAHTVISPPPPSSPDFLYLPTVPTCSVSLRKVIRTEERPFLLSWDAIFPRLTGYRGLRGYLSDFCPSAVPSSQTFCPRTVTVPCPFTVLYLCGCLAAPLGVTSRRAEAEAEAGAETDSKGRS